DDADVLSLLRSIITPERKGAEAKTLKPARLNISTVDSYLKSKQLSKKEKEVILNFLRDMNLLGESVNEKGHGFSLEES
ncbi:MAG: hypothetical protein M3Q07_21080, partial [Pseudobdellovibrionaceae bacterium]|nr:hypothetical protein [Pseudobdellovibrionaceae bacterium]